MSFYDHFEEILERYNFKKAMLRWITDELMLHPTISVEEIKKLPGLMEVEYDSWRGGKL